MNNYNNNNIDTLLSEFSPEKRLSTTARMVLFPLTSVGCLYMPDRLKWESLVARVAVARTFVSVYRPGVALSTLSHIDSAHSVFVL